VPQPAQTVLFGELARASGGDHAMAHFWKQFHAPPEIDAQRHRPGTGAAFADGHARTQSFESLFDLAADRDRFNPGATR
jgi:prepilin-type processing-associated H-X9-DG protein